MKQVRLKSTAAGAWGTGERGDVVSMPDAEADGMLAGGYAEPVEFVATVVPTEAIPPASRTNTKQGGKARKSEPNPPAVIPEPDPEAAPPRPSLKPPDKFQ
jgi:hypothetical protein